MNLRVYGPEGDAWEAVQLALKAVQLAEEKCIAAEFGQFVLVPVHDALARLEEVSRVIEGRA